MCQNLFDLKRAVSLSMSVCLFSFPGIPKCKTRVEHSLLRACQTRKGTHFIRDNWACPYNNNKTVYKTIVT